MEVRALRDFLARVLKVPGVLAVYLFGSRARETGGLESDLDVAVVLDGPATPDLHREKTSEFPTF